MLADLVSRGLSAEDGLLVVIDGAKATAHRGPAPPGYADPIQIATEATIAGKRSALVTMTDDTKNALPALVLAVFGLTLTAVVTLVLFLKGMSDAKDMAAVAGVFTGITGTLVGTFLGVHVGATGKAKLQTDRDRAVKMQEKAMSRLTPDQRRELTAEMEAE